MNQTVVNDKTELKGLTCGIRLALSQSGPMYSTIKQDWIASRYTNRSGYGTANETGIDNVAARVRMAEGSVSDDTTPSDVTARFITFRSDHRKDIVIDFASEAPSPVRTP